MASDLVPLILCLESVNGEDVAVQVEPDDNFRTFLQKANEVLGFEIDINCITKNEPVSLTDNVYHFLIKAEKDLKIENEEFQKLEEGQGAELPEVKENDDLVDEKPSEVVYMLEDGTQVKASSIRFENNIAIIGMDDEDASFEAPEGRLAPVKREGAVGATDDDGSPGYRLVPNGDSNFESQFSEFLGKHRTPISRHAQNASRIKERGVDAPGQETGSTRDTVLEMLKDSPIATEDGASANKVRLHNVRKTNPSRANPTKRHDSKPSGDDDDKTVECHLCSKADSKDHYKVYIADNSGDAPAITMKHTCEDCLDREYAFQTATSKILEPDELVVVRNDVQMIYKRRSISLVKRKNEDNADFTESKLPKLAGETTKHSSTDSEQLLFERITLPKRTQPSSILRKEASDSDLDSELNQVEILDSAQDQVRDFICMKREQAKNNNLKFDDEEYTCRLCNKSVMHIALAISHGIHHQNIKKQEFPCILCEKVFSKFSHVRTHMKSEHKGDGRKSRGTSSKPAEDQNSMEILEEDKNDVTIALKSMLGTNNKDVNILDKCQPKILTGIKLEPAATVDDPDDDGIWIIQTGSSDGQALADEELLVQALLAENDATDIDPDILKVLKENLLKAVRGESKGQDLDLNSEYLAEESFECFLCRKLFDTPLQLTNHKCRARGARRPGRPRKNFRQADAPRPRVNKSGKSSMITQPKKQRIVKFEEQPFIDDEDADPDWKVEEIDESDHDDDMPVTLPSTEVKKEPSEDNPNSKCISSECEYCGKRFMSKVRLRFHEQFHLPPHTDRDAIAYECPRCPAEHPKDPTARRGFVSEAALFDHLHFGHGKRRLWTCPVSNCQRTFNKKATFAKHVRTHSGVRRYACDKCGKRFLDKQTLVEHGVTHMKVKPFQCHICLKHMTRRSRLRIHLRAHESELVANSVYCCRRCGRGFRDMDAAKEHAETNCCLNDSRAISLKEATDAAKLDDGPGHSSDNPENVLNAEDDNNEKGRGTRVSEEDDMDPDEAIDGLGAFNDEAEEQKLIMMSALTDDDRAVITVVRVEKAFRCEFCEDVFLMESALNKHRGVHEGLKNPYMCHICKVSFPTYSRVTTHKTTHGYYRRSQADIKREETMFVSGRTEPSRESRAVDDSRPPVSRDAEFPVVKHFLCNTCDKSYLHWTNLQIHRRMKHSSAVLTHKCKLCDKQFPNSWGVAYHRKKCHGLIPVPTGKTQVEDETYDDYNCDKPFVRFSYTCKDCGQVLRNKATLHKHRRTEHGEIMLKIDSKNGFYTCSECGRKFATKVGIETHIKNKHKNIRNIQVMGSHICPRCGKKYAHASGLYTHIKRIHEQIANHPCPLCELSFFSRYELDAHLRKHNDERPFLCDICGQAFRTSSVRNEHQRIHSDVRPYKCDTCGMAFRRSGALKNHQLIHTGDKKFFCPRCPKRFRIRSDLKTHLKLKHPGETGQLLVLEINGLDPNPRQILEQLSLNNIPPEKIVGLTEVGVPKGIHIPSTIPIGEITGAGPSTLVFDENGAAALVADGGTHFSSQYGDDAEDDPPPRRGRGIGRGPRRPRGSVAAQNAQRSQLRHGRLDANDSDSSMHDLGVPMLLHPTEAILLDDGSIVGVVKQDPDAGDGASADGATTGAHEMVLDESGRPGVVDDHGHLHLLSAENLMFTDDGQLVIQGTGEDGNIINLQSGAIIRIDENGRTTIEHAPQRAVSE